MSQRLFGIIDWDSPALVNEYYPPDLPEDWRLDYYANEYAVVAVPQQKWLDANDEMLEEWLEAAGDDLYFLFEADIDPGAEVISRLKSLFSRQFLGIVTHLGASDVLLQRKQLIANNHDICVFYIRSQNENKSYLKELRFAFEQALPECRSADQQVFIVQGEHSQIETLGSVQILLDLLGEAY